MGIDCQGCIRQEVDDIGLTALVVADARFRLPPCNSLPDLMRKLGELGCGVSPFLDVKIRTIVYCFDYDFFAATPGEENKRDIPTICF